MPENKIEEKITYIKFKKNNLKKVHIIFSRMDSSR